MSMQFRDGITAFRRSQGKDAHAERLAMGLFVACQVVELLTGQTRAGARSPQGICP
ncbi:MAG: hypothetical protein MZV64_62545 [Ignavibacteriales bacterium]|nr:hypothetical protein [Ignavibacteriales bacterium]